MIKVRVHLENPEGKVIVRTLTFVAPPCFNFSANYTILSRQNTILAAILNKTLEIQSCHNYSNKQVVKINNRRE